MAARGFAPHPDRPGVERTARTDGDGVRPGVGPDHVERLAATDRQAAPLPDREVVGATMVAQDGGVFAPGGGFFGTAQIRTPDPVLHGPDGTGGRSEFESKSGDRGMGPRGPGAVSGRPTGARGCGSAR